MQTGLSESIQDYLKAIYHLTDKGEAASTHLIAQQMGIRAASVTVMVQRMAQMEPALVDYHKHKGVYLTPTGRQEALRVIRRHRLIELFLVEKLGYSWDEVHLEAEQLEHSASDRFVNRLANSLGNPAFDPHGEPIPDRDLRVPESHNVLLSSIAPGEQVIVRQIDASDAKLLSYLGGLGISPGAGLEVISRVSFDLTLRVKLAGTQNELVFGPEVSGRIQVERREADTGINKNKSS